MAGIWGMGMERASGPHIRGFERPFALLDGAASHFSYAAYTAPHLELQVPDKLPAFYRERYDDGYENLTFSRLDRAKQMGLQPKAVLPSARLPEVPFWSGLSKQEQRQSTRSIELYGAMVESLEYNIDRLVEHLKRTSRYENKVFIFLSDNGPQGGDLYRKMRNRP